jgi:hypothetical protein
MAPYYGESLKDIYIYAYFLNFIHSLCKIGVLGTLKNLRHVPPFGYAYFFKYY